MSNFETSQVQINQHFIKWIASHVKRTARYQLDYTNAVPALNFRSIHRTPKNILSLPRPSAIRTTRERATYFCIRNRVIFPRRGAARCAQLKGATLNHYLRAPNPKSITRGISKQLLSCVPANIYADFHSVSRDGGGGALLVEFAGEPARGREEKNRPPTPACGT